MDHRDRRIPRLVLGSLLAALGAVPAAADEAPLAVVGPPGPQFAEGTGSATALAGDLLAIGSPGFDVGREMSIGRASLHRWDGAGWELLQVFEPPAGDDIDEFGKSIALSPDGEWLAVGAPRYGVGGSVFVYRQGPGGWSLHQQLIGPTPASGDDFGRAVALGPDLLLVGAPGRDVLPHSGSGMTYAYRLGPGGFAFESDLLITGFAGANGGYGECIALDGDTAVIGAPHTPQFSVPFGMVHVLRFDGAAWNRLVSIAGHLLVSTSGAFGRSVAIDGDRMLVGAPEDDDAGESSRGSAWVFRENGAGAWPLEQQVVTASGQAGDWFGYSVALDGEQLVVGSLFANSLEGGGGAGLLFRLVDGTWQEQGRLQDPGATTADLLGVSAAIEGDLVAMGATSYASGATHHGAAFVFDLLESDWAWLGHGLAGDLGTPVLQPRGALAAGETVTLELRHAVASAPVVLVAGLSVLGLPLKGGVLVPNPDALVDGLATDADGELLLPTVWPAGVPIGVDIVLQAWVVDASGPKGLSASHGVSGTTS